MADYGALIARYFPRDQWANAYRVMLGESGGDPHSNNTKGEDSRGLFQLNVAAGANPELARYNLYDPETNVRIAAQMYAERGWQPWTAARNLGLVGDAPTQVGGDLMGDPIDDYLNQITGEGGTDTLPVGGTVTAAPGAESPSSSTLQDVLSANGTVTSIVPLPQSEQDSLAAIMGGASKEPVLRYWFENGRYVDVGSQTSNIYRGTAVTALGNKAPKTPSPVSALDIVPDPRTGQPIKYRDPVTGQLIDLPDKLAPELYYDVPRSTADPMSGLNQEWTEKGTYADTMKVGDTLYGLRKGGTQYQPIQTFPRAAGADNATTWATLAQNQREFDWESGVKWPEMVRQWQAEQEATERRQKLMNAVSLANNWTGNLLKAAPMAMTPGQTQFLSFEPGGPVEQLAKMSGSAYNAGLYKPTPIPFDQQAMWQQAVKAAAGGG